MEAHNEGERAYTYVVVQGAKGPHGVTSDWFNLLGGTILPRFLFQKASLEA